jgi:hypothetical protein
MSRVQGSMHAFVLGLLLLLHLSQLQRLKASASHCLAWHVRSTRARLRSWCWFCAFVWDPGPRTAALMSCCPTRQRLTPSYREDTWTGTHWYVSRLHPVDMVWLGVLSSHDTFEQSSCLLLNQAAVTRTCTPTCQLDGLLAQVLFSE